MQLSTSWSRARVTLALTIAITAVWVVLSLREGLNYDAAFWGGFISARVGESLNPTGAAPLFLTPLIATFLHANWIHLLFNLLFLIFCGRPTEAVLGPVSFGLLYVLGAYGAAAVHYFVEPSTITPMIGASGAISAVLGAYAILFGRNKVKVGNPTLALWLNALWLMAAWVILQLVVVYTFAGMGGAQIAVGAHIGGFLVGLALANPLLLLRYRKA